MSRLHIPAGTAAGGGDPVLVTPESAGWTYCGLRVIRLAAGGSRELLTGPEEVAILPLAGGGLTVEAGGRRFPLEGRESVFARVTDWVYAPIDSELRLSSEAGAEVAIASARASKRFEPVRMPAEAVPVETRGAGTATRQVNNFMEPSVFGRADKLVCVEVLTPDGNTSSYPPHRHDDEPGSLSNNEEIYYFRIGRAGGTAHSAQGFGLHRTYTSSGAIDATVAVRDGDVFLVPRGYHGPCVAMPGYPMYYLNVLAGPDDARSLAFVDDPSHTWVRGRWADLAVDPRIPMTSAAGPVR
jgi:5-deoxy-glucuronate isomerase